MSEVRSWYCKTEGLGVEQVQAMFDLAIEYGTQEYEGPNGLLFEYKMFGVDDENETVFYDNKDCFNAPELQYNQIEHYIKTGEILMDQGVYNLSDHVHTMGDYLVTETYANIIIPKDSPWDTRKDLLLEVQKLCKENNIAIQVYEDEIVVNFTNDDNEYVVESKSGLDKLLLAKKELTSFERKY
jgi:hypothetical protein